MKVGIDVGGTFTDGVAISSAAGPAASWKEPSTPPRVDEGALAVLRALNPDASTVEAVLHGTTVATNALIERRIARTALLTTEGFRDVLAIGTQLRPDLYDPFQTKPDPLVPRDLRFEVSERVAADGSVVRPIREEDVRRVARRIRRADVQAVAVVFLFSYVNPDHEVIAARILSEECPDLEVALSSEVSPQWREYPRTSTTAVNAALRPVISGYLHGLQASSGSPVLVMQSNGGVIPAGEALRLGHHLLLSGPAGGVVGAAMFAEANGVRDLVTMDMGGTSFEACLVVGGRPFLRGEIAVAGHQVLAPALDLVTVGAGGGSLARVDPGGALRVGPESAGADPGPAAYGRGGDLPTVTDANVVLGRIDPDRFLEGRIPLDVEAARRALHDHVARPLDLSDEEAAHAVLQVASATMARALRVVTVGRGRDPSELPLVAFGGAGPLHGARLAEEIGSPTVLVPPLPGFISAVGLLATELRTEAAETVLRPGGRSAESAVRRTAAGLRKRAAARLGLDPTGAVLAASVDCRYVGQGYELTVPLDRADPGGMAQARSRFHAVHDAVYGHAAPEEPVEIVAVRVTASAPGGGLDPAAVRPRSSGAARPAEVRKVFDAGVWVDTAVHDRASLGAGWSGEGPLLIEEGASTVWVPSGHRCRADEVGTLEITRG